MSAISSTDERLSETVLRLSREVAKLRVDMRKATAIAINAAKEIAQGFAKAGDIAKQLAKDSGEVFATTTPTTLPRKKRSKHTKTRWGSAKWP